MQSIFDEVRESASRQAWSRGVELARANSVTAERIDAREAQLRVAVPGAPVAVLVTLLLDADAWSCECPGPEDPCEHVAAAVIALRRAREEGRDLASPQESGAGVLHYALRRVPGGLAVDRVVVCGGEHTPLAASLRALATGRVAGPRVVANEADLAVDDAIQGISGRTLSRGALLRVLQALASSERVTLDGEPVRVSPEPVAPEARLVDRDGDFLLTVELRPGVTASLGDDAVLCGNVIRPLRETRLDGRELAEYPRGKIFRADEAARLVSEILPDLARRIAVDVQTTRLPRTTRGEPPRARVATSRDGDALVVRADVVYGDPPAARVVLGRLVAVQGVVPIRDEAAERVAARRIQTELELPIGTEVSVRGEEAIALATRLGQFSGTVAGDAQHAFFRAPPLSARFEATADGFDAWFESSADDAPRARRVDGAAVLRAWSAGESLVLLPGGGLAPLPADWLARFGRQVADLLDARDAAGALPRAALPALAQLCDALEVPRPAHVEPLAALVDDFRGIPHAALPADLAATLRGYQKTGVDWLVFLRDAGLGALLADDMGLGKTLEVLCALRHGERTLVVAPTSVLFNWESEIRRFRPALTVSLYHGPGRALDPEADVTLTTYALLRLDADALGAIEWDTVVLDEAQAIKNPDSQVARAAHALRAQWRVAMTGTPVENRLDELWSQLHFANPGLLGLARRLRRAHRATDRGGRRRRRRPPARTHPPVRTAAPQERSGARAAAAHRGRAARRTRRARARRLRRGARGDAGAGRRAPRVGRKRARRARSAAATAPGGVSHGPRARPARGHRPRRWSCSSRSWRRPSPKVTRRSSSRSGRVCSISSSRRCARPSIAFTRLDGSTRDRGAVVAQFQDDAGPPVLLISLQAGGTGLQPHRRRSRVPARPLVEPRRRRTGRRSRPPHRPDAPGPRLPAGRRGHRRGTRPRAAGHEAQPRRSGARRRDGGRGADARRPARAARLTGLAMPVRVRRTLSRASGPAPAAHPGISSPSRRRRC